MLRENFRGGLAVQRSLISATVLGLLIAGASLWQPGGTPLPDSIAGFFDADQLTGRGGVIKKNRSPKIGYAPGVVMLAFHPNASESTRSQVFARYNLTFDQEVTSPYFVRAFLPKGVSVESAIIALQREPSIRLAEADRQILPEQSFPNDPQFSSQYGLHNTGQTGGTPDADIDAPEAWQLIGNSGEEVIVAVLDDGCDIDHPDLRANIAGNQAEINGLPGVDDDGNGFVDDLYGWDFADNDNNPRPATTGDAHGTHTSGTVGAVRNNGIGVSGIGGNVKVLPIRMYRGQGTWISDLIRGIDYSRQNGAKVMSVSYNIDGYTQLLVEAIQRAGQADIVYVNSAGNNGQNIDGLRGAIKALAPNATFVAATDDRDGLASFSNYGSTVDFAAPGVDILSTTPGNTYGFSSGTSMACPHGAAVIAIVRSLFPDLTAVQVIARVKGTSESKPSLSGRISGGRINLANTLDTDNTPPSNPGVPTLLRRSASTLVLSFTASGDDGNVGSASSYDFRYSTNPITSANFGSATRFLGNVPTASAGSNIRVGLNGLFPGNSYYVAVQAFDNVGNASGIVSSGPFATGSSRWIDRVEGLPSFTASGPWAVTTEDSVSPTHSWTDSPGGNYANNIDHALTQTGTFSITEQSTLKFMAKTALEAGYDFLRVDISTNNGSTWTQVLSVTGNNSWRSYSIPLASYLGQSIKVRFRITTDGSVTSDGIHLDDFAIINSKSVYFDNMEGTSNFNAQSPWDRTTARSTSPTRSWTDSPAGDYGNNINIWLRGTNSIGIGDIADAQAQFRLYAILENNYDYLNFATSLDNGATWQIQRQITGENPNWATISAPLGLQDQVRVAFNLTTDSSVVRDGVYIDDLLIVGEPYLARLNGTLRLQSIVGGNRPVTIQIRRAGTQTVLHSFVVDGNAAAVPYAIDVPETGNVDIAVRAPGFLTRVISGVNLQLNTPLDVELLNGDVNGDNLVNRRDWSAVEFQQGRRSGDPKFNPRADLNGDGRVNDADIVIVKTNFGRSGDN
jgi:hypothetical protein